LGSYASNAIDNGNGCAIDKRNLFKCAFYSIGFNYESNFCHYWVLASHAYLFGSKSLLDCLRDRLIGGAQSNIKLTLHNNPINKTIEILNISKGAMDS